MFELILSSTSNGEISTSDGETYIHVITIIPRKFKDGAVTIQAFFHHIFEVIK